MEEHPRHGQAQKSETRSSHTAYWRLGAMVAISFVVMYVLMYAMVNSFSNVYNNFNQVYMAGLMSAPMALIELALMRSMYANRQINSVVIAASVMVAVVFYILIRQQVGITRDQFLRSMIPHHAGAILMCQQGPTKEPEVQELCQSIIKSQEREIRQMKALLHRSQQ